jgi:hypothetical protein
MQPQMAQKPMLREKVHAPALRASQKVKRAEVLAGARCAWWVGGAWASAGVEGTRMDSDRSSGKFVDERFFSSSFLYKTGRLLRDDAIQMAILMYIIQGFLVLPSASEIRDPARGGDRRSILRSFRRRLRRQPDHP